MKRILRCLALVSIGAPFVCALDSAWAAPSPDAGAAPSAKRADGGGGGDGATSQPASLPIVPPADWKGDQIKALKDGVRALEDQTQQISKLRPDEVEVPAAVAKFFSIDLRDPQAAKRRAGELAMRRMVLQARIDEEAERIKLIAPLLRKPIRRVAYLEKRRRRVPRALREQAVEGEKRLSLMRLEQRILVARFAWLQIKENYLLASQPARLAADAQRRKDLAAKAIEEGAAADKATKLAEQTEKQAGAAQKAALAAQKRARSEAQRLLAGERARLEGVRVEQAKHERLMAGRLKALAKLRNELEIFRGKIAARVDSYKAAWPKSAPRFDLLYDEVAAKLTQLVPQARESLWRAIRGVDAPPTPGPFPSKLRKLGEESSVLQLRELSLELEKTAERLDEGGSELVRKRLALLQQEVSWLNEHRTNIFAFCSSDKRSDLTGISRATLRQLLSEVSQAGFDGVYWVYKRLHQIDLIPGLIVDVFTVGSLLWLVVKLLLLLLLLRYLLKRWDAWLEEAVPKVARSVELGTYAMPAAKAMDVLRHIGPALLVLVATIVIYRMLGGVEAAAEFQVLYVFFFWFAIYRLQLRLVEALAKYVGLEKALRAERGEEEQESFEGPPDPPWRIDDDEDEPTGTMAARAQAGQLSEDGVIPAPVLAVRSIRIATLYLLVILLLLQLTAIAVGKGTIYGLVVTVFWWMAIPYAYKLLNWWRPHIVSAYERLAKARSSSRLQQMVVASEERFYGVFIVAAAFFVVFADKTAKFARRYLASLDMTKRLLAFLFRRRVAKHAQQSGRVVEERQQLPDAILERFPTGPIDREQGALPPRAMKPIREAFDTWQKQRADGSVALVGAAGMGKSTLLRMLERELDTSVIRGEARTKIVRAAKVVSWIAEIFGFTKPSSEKELIKLIREDSRPVVAIDNCHNLFLRRVGGFEGWESFVRIVNETCDNVFWVMSFNRAAYDYLFNAGGQIEYFRRTVQMKPWRERLIQKLTLLRMSRAHCQVSFSDLMVAHVPNVDVHAQVGRTSAGYFRMLWDFTDGNPRLASSFWLDSLVLEEGKTDAVKVHLFAEPAIQELEKLPMNVVFVLTAIAEHENLSATEVAQATRLPGDFCRFAINNCLEDGFLQRMDDGRVRISVRWQRPILRFLRRKHLLHDV